jgi:hypothetical protein
MRLGDYRIGFLRRVAFAPVSRDSASFGRSGLSGRIARMTSLYSVVDIFPSGCDIDRRLVL